MNLGGQLGSSTKVRRYKLIQWDSETRDKGGRVIESLKEELRIIVDVRAKGELKAKPPSPGLWPSMVPLPERGKHRGGAVSLNMDEPLSAPTALASSHTTEHLVLFLGSMTSLFTCKMLSCIF